MITALRSLLFNLVFYLNLTCLLVFGIWLLVAPRSWAMKGLKLWGRTTMFWQRLIVGTRVELKAAGNIPDGPLLVACKHQSAWDTVALHAFFRDPAIVLKKELMWIPVMGWFSRKFALIPIDRSASAGALRALRGHARKAVADGRQVIIFPEGTRTVPGAPPDYKTGVALLYRDLGVPCLPVALNSGLFWPRRRLMRYPGTLTVEFLEPIPPGLDRAVFMARLEEAIETASDRLIAEAARAPNPPPLPAPARARFAARTAAG